ncbi:MAG TPA: proteasome-type protease [Burkholderiaceae bacterium]|nr:proteasome-type protease [Burkholderiaceae bacterium]
MTYCVAIRLDAGLVFLSDSRTNAGVDQISTFRKMTVFERQNDRVMVLLTSGNLAISQAARKWLSERSSADGTTLWSAKTMGDAVNCVSDAIRAVYARDAEQLKKFGVDFNCSFLFGGQIGDEPPRLFQLYSAGNFIEATPENPYFQIGEAKYGKPIIDRVVTCSTPLDEAAKCALISMDSTLRSNISVGLPLDLLVYEVNTLQVTRFTQIDRNNQYFAMIQNTWGQRLRQVFGEIPNPNWSAQTGDGPHALRVESAEASNAASAPPRAPVPPDAPANENAAKPIQTVAQNARPDQPR